MNICNTCNKNKATRKYKIRQIIKNGANSHKGYKIHHICDECWYKMIRGGK